MIQDEDVAESGGNTVWYGGRLSASLLPGQVNGLRALVAHAVGINCPRGGGIAKPTVCSGLMTPHNQPHTVKTAVPDAPSGISCCSKMILADTFLTLS